MKIKFKSMLIIFAIGAFLPSVIFAHSGHGRAESNIFHYVIDHTGNHYVWILLLVCVLVLLSAGVKNK